MKKIGYIILGIILICGTAFLISFKNPYQELFENTSTESLVNELLLEQTNINNKLTKISKNNTYTFENAYVELNPYQISPLSAIIIFQTEKESEIKVYLNDEYLTTTTNEKTHIIPIYGLYENTENHIKLIKDTEEKEYILKTEKSNLETFNILERSNQLNNEELYFQSASYKSGLSAYDSFGNLRFYLTQMFRMDVEWLENGHFIVGIPDGQFAENFYGFVEMDYLGKIYNYYTLEHGFSFESQILKNGNYLTAGGSTPVYIKEQVVTEIDPSNGETINTVNFYDIFKNIDKDFPDKYLGQAAIRNGFYYNEDTDEMIVSFRGIDTVFSINYKSKTLNWIFSNNELFQKEVWKDYLITSTDGYYPLGQHSPFITKEGYIGFFNNGYERFHGFEVGGKDLVSNYQNNYSRAELYEIKNNTSTRIWSYEENKKYFSHQYGSFRILENGNKLIDFGWTLKEEYRNNPTATLSNSEKNIDNTYAYIVELDEEDNVLLRATCEEGKFRVFKHSLYTETTPNPSLLTLNIYNTIPKEELTKTSIAKKELQESPEWIYDIALTNHTFTTNYNIQENDELILYFINHKGKVFQMDYKKKENSTTKRIFSLDLDKGDYLLYIKLNDKLYKTNKKIQI